MATIGSSPLFQPQGIFTGAPTGAAAMAPTTPGMMGPAGPNYNFQLMAEMEKIMALISLLQPGASAPTGAGNPATSPAALNAAVGKGGGKATRTLAQVGSKPNGVAPALNKVGTKAP